MNNYGEELGARADALLDQLMIDSMNDVHPIRSTPSPKATSRTVYCVSERSNYNDNTYFFPTYEEAYACLLTKYTSEGAADLCKMEYLYE